MASSKAKTFNQKAFIRNALRRVFARTPAYYLCRDKVKQTEYTKGGAKRCFYMCEICGFMFVRDDTQVDHINPCQPVDGHDPDYNEFIDLLFNGQLQCVCKSCHKEKSALEATQRAEARRALKLPEEKKRAKRKEKCSATTK